MVCVSVYLTAAGVCSREKEKDRKRHKAWTDFMFTSKVGAFIQTCPKAARVLERTCKCIIFDRPEKICLTTHGESGEFFSRYRISVPAGRPLLCKAAL